MTNTPTAHSKAAVTLRDLVFSWTKTPTPDSAKATGPVTGPTIAIDHFHVGQGESVFLRGPSGSGKSTLLGLICGVLTAQSGAMHVAGTDMMGASAAERDALRARDLGVIFQLFNLAPYLSVIDNVTLPCQFSAQRRARATRERALADEAARLLSRLGLGPDVLAKNTVHNLSVGQQQRVAAARALIGGPRLVIADEPTSALDADARDAFVSLLKEECTASGASLIFVSHDGALAPHFDRAVDLGAINRPTAVGASPAAASPATAAPETQDQAP